MDFRSVRVHRAADLDDRHRLWLVLIGYLLVSATIYLVLDATGFAAHWQRYAFMALSLLIGFEADSLMRWTLDRRSYNYMGSVAGANFDECERRFSRDGSQRRTINPSNLDRPGDFAATTVPEVPRTAR